uniref:Uncharacterized protein n=1 Tax=Rhizophora mucronata TaxID=61149 RepID=A0A2P2NL81_RHIMU
MLQSPRSCSGESHIFQIHFPASHRQSSQLLLVVLLSESCKSPEELVCMLRSDIDTMT